MRPVALAGGEAVVDIDGLVGAVKAADAEMDDAGRQAGAVIAGPLDSRRQGAEAGLRQARGHLVNPTDKAGTGPAIR